MSRLPVLPSLLQCDCSMSPCRHVAASCQRIKGLKPKGHETFISSISLKSLFCKGLHSNMIKSSGYTNTAAKWNSWLRDCFTFGHVCEPTWYLDEEGVKLFVFVLSAACTADVSTRHSWHPSWLQTLRLNSKRFVFFLTCFRLFFLFFLFFVWWPVLG